MDSSEVGASEAAEERDKKIMRMGCSAGTALAKTTNEVLAFYK